MLPTASVNTSSHIWSPETVVSQLNVSSGPIFVTKQSTGELESVGLGFFFFAVYNESISRFSLGNPSGFCKIPLKDNKNNSSVLGGAGE